MLSQKQKAELDEQGFVVLREMFAPQKVSAAADAIWQHLEQRGCMRDDPATWQIQGPWLGLKPLRETPAFQALQSPDLESTIDELLGENNWPRLAHWGGFLVSFPDRTSDEWTAADPRVGTSIFS